MKINQDPEEEIKYFFKYIYLINNKIKKKKLIKRKKCQKKIIVENTGENFINDLIKEIKITEKVDDNKKEVLEIIKKEEKDKLKKQIILCSDKK